MTERILLVQEKGRERTEIILPKGSLSQMMNQELQRVGLSYDPREIERVAEIMEGEHRDGGTEKPRTTKG